MGLALGALAVLAILLVGCGDGGGDSSSSGGAPVKLGGTVTDKGSTDITDKGASPTVEVELDDSYFSPTFIKAAPGAKVTVELKNEGSLAHTFTTADGTVDEELQPGKTATVTVTVPQAGAAAFACRFHGANGMKGALYSKAGVSAGSSASTTESTGSSSQSDY